MNDQIPPRDSWALPIAEILEQIGNAVVATDFDGRVLYWNTAAANIYGRTANEMMGRLFSECCQELMIDEDNLSVRETIDRTGKWSGAVLQTLADSRQILVECERYLFRDGEGCALGTMAMMRDVTKERQKDLERIQSGLRARETASLKWDQLRRNGDVLDCLLKNLPVCVYVKDEQGRYLFNNRDTTQFTPGMVDWAGKDDEELFGTETGRLYRQSDLTTLTSGQPIRTVESGPLGSFESTFLTVKFPISVANGSRYVAGISIDITDSTREREQVRRQSALLDLSNSAIIMVDLEDRVSYWNHGAERLYGWTAAECVGKLRPEILRAEFGDPYDEIWAQYLRDGLWEGEFTARTKQGDPITVLSKWCLLRDPSGNPVAGMVISTDITATKLAFEELRRAEAEAAARAEELAAILDAVPAAIFIAHDRECRQMTSSRAAFDLLHLPRGANPSKSAPPEEGSGSFSIMSNGVEVPTDQLPVQRAAATGIPVQNSELTIALTDGTVRDIFGHAVPLLGVDGQVRGAVGAFIDVTERNRAEQAARQHQAILKAVLDATSDLVFLKDLSGRYLAVNRSAASNLGKIPDEVIGRDDYELFPAAIADKWIEEDREVLATGQSLTYEDELPGNDGVVHLLSVKSVCRDENGDILGVVGVSRDITQRKALELELRRRERDLTEAHRIARLGTWK
jgi:PAS domain S-box-containing protein